VHKVAIRLSFGRGQPPTSLGVKGNSASSNNGKIVGKINGHCNESSCSKSICFLFVQQMAEGNGNVYLAKELKACLWDLRDFKRFLGNKAIKGRKTVFKSGC